MNNRSRKNRRRQILPSNSTMPPLLSTALFIILIGFILTAKGLMLSSKEAAVPALAEDYSLIGDDKLNQSEDIVLTMLQDVLQLSQREGRTENTDSVYYNTLKKYLTEDGVELSKRQAVSISSCIIDIQDILHREGKRDYTELSLDGRNVVFYLLGRIYKDCGLQLIGNAKGDIETISLHSGRILYHNTDEHQSDFQISTLVIVILFLFVLFISCLLFARKHQLFGKEEKYDGYDKERFA